jgi:hypothetical protein
MAYRPLFIILVSGVCVFMMACTPTISSKLPKLTALTGEKEQADFSAMQRANFAAADKLFQEASSRMDPSYRVQLVQLNNLGEPLAEGTPAIAWLVPQQVGQRLARLGLKVQQPQKAPSAAEQKASGALPLQLTNKGHVMTAQSSPRQAGQVYVEGDYAYMNDEIFVSLRLVGGRTNNILSSADYTMPVNADLYSLIDPRATDRIFGSAWMQ